MTAYRVLIESQHNQSSIVTLTRVELGVAEERDEPVLQPRTSIVNGGVMSVVDHVRGDEDPLRENIGVDVGGKVIEVTNSRCAGGDVGDSVVNDERRVLPSEVGVVTS